MSPVLHFGVQSFHGPFLVGGISFPLLSKTFTVMFGYLALNRSITFEQLAHGDRSVSKLIVPVAAVLSPNCAATLFKIFASESHAAKQLNR